jgi:DNA-binding IclR family transcriptional regulator
VLVRVAASSAGRSLAGLCRPVLEELSASTGMMVNLQVLTQDRSRVLDVVRPERLAMISDLREEVLPVHRFAGPLALVAVLDAAGRAPYLRLAEADGAVLEGPQGLLAALDRAAAEGFAVQRGRAERLVGSVSRAVTVAPGAAPVCALTLVGPVAEFDDERLKVLCGALARACEKLAGEVLRVAGRGEVDGR